MTDGASSSVPSSRMSSKCTSQPTSRRRSEALVELPETEKEYEEDVPCVMEFEAERCPVASHRTGMEEQPGYSESICQNDLIEEQMESVGGPPPERHDFALGGLNTSTDDGMLENTHYGRES